MEILSLLCVPRPKARGLEIKMSKAIILNNSTTSVQYLCKKDKRLAKVISMVGEITYKPYEDSYDFLVSQIIGQMLSNKVACKIYDRLKTLCNGSVTLDSISNLSDTEIKSIGTANSKINYIRCLTDAVKSGELDFSTLPEMSNREVLKKLTSIRGIGNWSAKMYLIFVLDRQDILPTEDVAFLQGYCWAYKTTDYSSTSIAKKCKKWSPYASIAARYLYHALDNGLTKEEFHLFK